MTKGVDNPWSRKKNPTTTPSGGGSSQKPKPTPKRGIGKLAGLKRADSPSTPSSGKPPKGSLARLSSGTRSNASTSQKPSAKMTSTATSSAGTRKPSARRMTPGSRSSNDPGTKPSEPRSRPSSTTTNANSSTQERRILETRQPFGGNTLHEGARNANFKRARRLATSFPPGASVRVEWDRDPAYASGPGEFYGVVDHYDEHGYLTAIGQDNSKLWIPCGLIRVRAAT